MCRRRVELRRDCCGGQDSPVTRTEPAYTQLVTFNLDRPARMSKDALSDLHGMKNLGRTTVLWLHAIGIQCRADLEATGVVNAYLAMRERGFRATRVALFSLHGALADMSWRDLSEAEKARLIAEANLPADDYRQAVG